MTGIPRRLLTVVAATTLCAGVLGTTSYAASSPPGRAAGRSDDGLLVFQREVVAGDHTQTDLYTVAPDGTGSAQLTATPNINEFGPVWGPGRQQIALWRTPAPFGAGSLWVMDADGGDPRRLTHGIDARDPAWSPDGTRLVYDVASNDLYTLRVSDGKDRQQLTTGDGFDFEPAWSPDGRRIAFTRGSATGDPGDIYLLTLATGRLTRLTHTTAYDHQVGWGPAGHRLVFERDFADRSAIFTMRRDGTGLQRVTTGAHFDVGPAYSPDSASIAFGSDRGSTLDNLWVVGADGSDPHQVLALTSAGFPDWR